jgi:hypothetical protein
VRPSEPNQALELTAKTLAFWPPLTAGVGLTEGCASVADTLGIAAGTPKVNAPLLLIISLCTWGQSIGWNGHTTTNHDRRD